MERKAISLVEDVFDNYLRSYLFEIKETKSSNNKIKKFKKNLEINFKGSLEKLKKNLRDQQKFNQIVSKIISEMDIEDKEIFEDTSDKEKEKDSLNNQQSEQNKSSLQDKKEENERVSRY